MNWILLFFTLELSITPNGTETLYNNRIDTEMFYNIIFSPEIILFNFLYITGDANIKMFNGNKAFNFNPVSLNSIFDIYIKNNGFILGYEHLCLHPIIPWNNILIKDQKFNKSYNKFYVRFSTKRNE